MKKVLFMMFAAASFTFASCDSPKENKTEAAAEQVREGGEAQADKMEEAADSTADKMEDAADKMEPVTPAAAADGAAAPAATEEHK